MDDGDGDTPRKRQSGKRFAHVFKKKQFSGNRFTRAQEEAARREAEAAAARLAEEAARANQPVARRTRRGARAAETPTTTPATPTTTTTTTAPTPTTSTATPSTSEQPDRPSSASSNKLRRSADPVVQEHRKNWSGFRIFDSDLLFQEIESEMVCRVCYASMKFEEVSQCGFSSIFHLKFLGLFKNY
ncbi:uncharacterized transmembrane protein DDB_G0282483-like [Thrips palmi]|uniref:Uncharacterized transmembrane protein DDB_G0282483-like n=1 Tax=Thrips palmi TaxID=161013 RepID=A0A6P8ZQP5_THRPL|nr:uncharacterized transmembrane protein DDB_G0282483-like [Thrips palmi]